jgi:hypothetical protein
MNAVQITAALEKTLVAAKWTVTSEVLTLAERLHAVRTDLKGSPRSDVCAVLIWLRREPVGSTIPYRAQHNVLFATSGVRNLARFGA